MVVADFPSNLNAVFLLHFLGSDGRAVIVDDANVIPAQGEMIVTDAGRRIGQLQLEGIGLCQLGFGQEGAAFRCAYQVATGIVEGGNHRYIKNRV